MFYELSASSHIQIPCHEFTGGMPKKSEQKDDQTEASHGNLVEEVMTHLLVEYCNKILPPKRGLCITVSQIDKIGDARIFLEDGGTYVDVDFRLLMFKPYNSQVIEGDIATSDASGIRISLGFFEQVFIPKHNLPQPCRFDTDTKTWIYVSKNEELAFEKDDTVYLKVTKTDFKGEDSNQNHMISPTPTPFPPKQLPTSNQESKDNDADEDSDLEDTSKLELLENKLLKQPMIVYGSFDGIGLGPSHWWE